MFMTTPRSSSERPVASDMRLLDQLLDAADVRLDLDRRARPSPGIGVICARIDVPVRVTDVGADARRSLR